MHVGQLLGSFITNPEIARLRLKSSKIPHAMPRKSSISQKISSARVVQGDFAGAIGR